MDDDMTLTPIVGKVEVKEGSASTKYERYQLEWMIEHGHSLKELIDELTEYQNDLELAPGVNLSVAEVYDEWLHDRGFGGEIFSSEQEYAMEDLPAITVGYDKQNECPDIEQKSGRTAVSVGYCFTVVDDQELTDINLKPTGEEVVLDGKVMPLMAGATFLDSQKVDDLLDRHGELRTDEYINHDVDSLAESATRAAAIRRDCIDKLMECAAARNRNVDR